MRGLEEFITHGESIGIPEDLQRHIADEWRRVRAAHGIASVVIEQPVVHDGWRVATNIDRIDETPDGRWICADIKSSRDVVKPGYLLQLCVGAASTWYDPDTGERTPWPVALDQTVGHIWQYPVAEAIEKHAAGEPLPTWTLHVVELEHGFTLGDTLHALKTDTAHREAFSVVEIAAILVNPPSLEEWRTLAATWGDLKNEAFSEYRFAHGITKDATDAERLAAYVGFDEVYAFRDVHVTPATRVEPVVVEPPPARDIDEGDDIDASTVATLGKRYARIPDERRSWVSMCAGKIRLNPDADGRPTERRAILLGALCELAEHEMDDDDGLRAIAAHVIGEDAWRAGVHIADVVASISLAEVKEFAAVASLVCMTLVPFEFGEGAARCWLTDDVKGRAA